MANTRVCLEPYSASFPSTNFPELTHIHTTERRPVLAFDAATVQGCRWRFPVWQGLTGTETAYIYYCMASATSGKVDFEITIEAVTDADALDLDAATGFATLNAANETVPGTAGYMGVLPITLTNDDGWAAGDLVWLKLERDADDGTDDTAAGDCYVLGVEIRDAV